MAGFDCIINFIHSKCTISILHLKRAFIIVELNSLCSFCVYELTEIPNLGTKCDVRFHLQDDRCKAALLHHRNCSEIAVRMCE